MTDVEFSGPYFDDAAYASAMGEFITESEHDIGEAGVQMVSATLGTVLQHPTGYYQSQIGYRDDAIDDNNVVYGPWLEGVGSRNAPETSFAGYHTFEHVAQALQNDADKIAQPALDRLVERLN